MIKHLTFPHTEDVDLIVSEFAEKTKVEIIDYNIIPITERYSFVKVVYSQHNKSTL